MSGLRIAFVVQRYGREVNGGAELHCRQLAEHLARRPEVERVTVLTSCARDHHRWKNHYPAGAEEIGGVRVERFAVPFARLATTQKLLERLIFKRSHPRLLEEAWLWSQGPVLPDLLRRLRAIERDYDAFVFFTYLYFPTARGLEQLGSRRVLVPTSHDEPPIRLELFRRVFALPDAIAYNTDEEQRFVEERFEVGSKLSAVVGCGIELPDRVEPARARPREAPYLLYLGRVEGAKGVRELARAFEHFKRVHAASWFDDGQRRYRGSELELVLAGGGTMKGLPRRADLVREGFVSDERKAALLAGCEALAMPSRYESLSLVLLEAWAAGRPAVVEHACRVTRRHVEVSGGGLCYRDAGEFSAALTRLLGDPELRVRQGAAGRRYVEERYSWPAVEDRMLQLIARMGRSSSGSWS